MVLYDEGMSVNPYESPGTPGQAPESPRYAFRFRLVELLVILGVIAILIGLLLPARRGSTEAGRRAGCSNNLKQIALALENYEREFGALPPAYTVDADGKPLHSWRTLILPYLEQRALYDRIDLSKPWDDPANKEAYDINIHTYHCPNGSDPRGHTTYQTVVADSGCLQPGTPRSRSDVTDNPSLTLIVVEVDAEHAVHWMSPMDADEAMIAGFKQSGKLPHKTGFHAACVDGSVRFLSSDTSPAALRAMISIAGDDDAAAQAGLD